MRESFTFFRSFADGLNDIEDDATYRRMCNAIINYALYDQEPDLHGLEMTAFRTWRSNIDASNRRRDGGRSLQVDDRSVQVDCRSVQVSDRSLQVSGRSVQVADTNKNKNINIKEKDKEKVVRFKPPTPQEVQQYAFEHGYSIDADRFVDFYESKGWMVGKSKMKDWKAAVRNWARSQRQERTTKGKFNNFEPSGTDWDAAADLIMAKGF